MICIIALLISLSFTAATTERHIIKYDSDVWDSLHLSSLPDDTVYILKNLKMTVADLSTEEISMYESIPGITVHKDGEAHIFDDEEPVPPTFTQNKPKNWGLDRVDQHEGPLDGKFSFSTSGEGVDVFIIDTGVNAVHLEFGSRAALEKNFAEDDEDRDCNGHGTHVSSTIGGIFVGIAKQAKIRGIKVLGCNGSGKLSNVIAGIDYVVGEHTKKKDAKTVINMSLGGGRNQAVNDAVEAAVAAGVVTVVAAGNSAIDACLFSPASAPNVISVAAADNTDTSASFTNHGKCVDLYAPGVAIYGAWKDGNSTYNTISGTSMASPHTAGVSALILSSGNATTPAEVKAKLAEVGTQNAIKSIPKNTRNILLYADPSWTLAAPKDPNSL